MQKLTKEQKAIIKKWYDENAKELLTQIGVNCYTLADELPMEIYDSLAEKTNTTEMLNAVDEYIQKLCFKDKKKTEEELDCYPSDNSLMPDYSLLRLWTDKNKKKSKEETEAEKLKREADEMAKAFVDNLNKRVKKQLK